MSRPMRAHWRAPDDYCESEPDADFTRDGMREECA